jgi:phosphoserine aminotransferase
VPKSRCDVYLLFAQKNLGIAGIQMKVGEVPSYLRNEVIEKVKTYFFAPNLPLRRYVIPRLG